MTADGSATEDLRAEGERFGRYLMGKPVEPALLERYVSAIVTLHLPAEGRDRRLLRLVGRYPWLLGPVDGGLALRRPASVVRARLLVMAAILEATPEGAEDFLPARRSPLYLAVAGLVAVRAGLRGVFGVVLVSLI